MENFKKVRSRIVDEESRIIYDNRLNFSLTSNQDLIWQMLEKIDGYGGILGLKEKLIKNSYKKILIFGGGYNGIFLAACLREFNIAGYLDNKVQTVINQPLIDIQTSILSSLESKTLPIYNPNYYAQNEDIHNSFVVISVPTFRAQIAIKKQLMDLGFSESNIFAFLPSNSLVPQYFQVFSPQNEETFVDCGVLDGDTCYDFARWCLGRYRKIFAFEADKTNYENCKINLAKLKDVELFNLGVWDKEEILSFNNTSSGFSNIVKNDIKKEQDKIVEIKTCKLDEVLEGEKITFIKMDIEGAELNALLGAKEIIKKQKPKLAICVYHKPSDMWEIPDLLLELNPKYTFKLRHYGPSAYETVLYAQ